MAWQPHPTASTGDRFQGSNKRPTVVDALWSLHTGQYMLYFACHTEPVRLTENLQGTRKSEQDKRYNSPVWEAGLSSAECCPVAGLCILQSVVAFAR